MANKIFTWPDIVSLFNSILETGVFAGQNDVFKIKLLRNRFNEQNYGYSLSLRSALYAVKFLTGEMDMLPGDFPDVIKLKINVLSEYYVLFDSDRGEFLHSNGTLTPYFGSARTFYALDNASSLADCKGLSVLKISRMEDKR